jgi:hypothetical protein
MEILKHLKDILLDHTPKFLVKMTDKPSGHGAPLE